MPVLFVEIVFQFVIKAPEQRTLKLIGSILGGGGNQQKGVGGFTV